MKNNKYRIINNISNYSFKDNFKSNFTINDKNKYSRNHSNEKEINNSNITYNNYNLTQNTKLKKEKERNNSFNNINNNNLKLFRIKFLDLKKKIKDFPNENPLILSFDLKSIKNNDINKNISSQYLISYFNYEIISIKSKNNLNDSLKNDIIILMKQLKEKESKILIRN